jgi:hypothetical protein
MLMLEELLGYIVATGDVVFETVTAYVTRWKEAQSRG